MSSYSQKVFSGATPTTDEWNDFLRDAHAKAPSMTPKAFAPFTHKGQNSYQILANQLNELAPRRDLQVVDLGCGDGYLVNHCLHQLGPTAHVHAVDMSPGELDVAKRTIKSSQVTFHLAMAQSLPLPDQSMDAVLSHMALMLMMPLAPVLAELRRVLKPGGIVAAVIGDSQKEFAETSLRAQVRPVIGDGFRKAFPNMKSADIGDRRLRTREGLDELFVIEAGFARVLHDQRIDLSARVPAERVWEFFHTKYLIPDLPQATRDQMRADMTALAMKHATTDGLVDLDEALRLIVVRR